jgi:hypothetical protein
MLRRTIQADIEVMAAIHAAAFAPADAWSAEVFDLQLAMPNIFGLLHQKGGLILARVAADEAEILTLAVVPLYGALAWGLRCWPRQLSWRQALALGRSFLRFLPRILPLRRFITRLASSRPAGGGDIIRMHPML